MGRDVGPYNHLAAVATQAGVGIEHRIAPHPGQTGILYLRVLALEIATRQDGAAALLTRHVDSRVADQRHYIAQHGDGATQQGRGFVLRERRDRIDRLCRLCADAYGFDPPRGGTLTVCQSRQRRDDVDGVEGCDGRIGSRQPCFNARRGIATRFDGARDRHCARLRLHHHRTAVGSGCLGSAACRKLDAFLGPENNLALRIDLGAAGRHDATLPDAAGIHADGAAGSHQLAQVDGLILGRGDFNPQAGRSRIDDLD